VKEDHRTLFWGVDKWCPCMKPQKTQEKDVLPHHFGCFQCHHNSNPTTPETYASITIEHRKKNRKEEEEESDKIVYNLSSSLNFQ